MENKGIWYGDLVKWITGLSILCYIGIFLHFGWTEEAIRQVIRWTARVSFVCFSLAFSGAALHLLIKNSMSFWLLMNRKHLGISFAISHYLHLLALGVLQYVFHPVFTKANLSSLAAGWVAYAFLTLMFLSSFESFAAYLSKKQFRWIHEFGSYWIWGVFLSTYLKRAGTGPVYWGFVGLLILILLLRIIKFTKKKGNRER